MKKIILIFVWLTSYIVTFAAKWPDINCEWLPGCNTESTTDASVNFIWKIVWELIKYVAVVAVIALMWAWIMYITSWWEEEKTKKAKKWITWALVGVFLSISWYFLINAINNANISL